MVVLQGARVFRPSIPAYIIQMNVMELRANNLASHVALLMTLHRRRRFSNARSNANLNAVIHHQRNAMRIRIVRCLIPMRGMCVRRRMLIV